MDCPENMMAASKHICAKCFDEIASDEEEFINLTRLLKKDNPEIKKIKSLFNREGEYADFLGPTEYILAKHFLENRKLKDKDVEKAIKNIKKNYAKDIDFFENELEKDIMFELSSNLQQNRKITHHELMLVLNYLLWCIDNRSWMADKQAYVKWSAYFLKLFDEKEMKKYEDSFMKIAKRMGIPKEKIDVMLLKSDKDVCSQKEKEENMIESEYFSLDDKEKFDFVIKHLMENPYLIELYAVELEEKKEYETAKRFYKKLLELMPGFPPAEISLGVIYKNMGNPHLAKHHLENALKTLDEVNEEIIPANQKEILINEINKELEGMKQENLKN